MGVKVVDPIQVTEAVYSASGIAEPDVSRGEVEWLPESQKEVITQLSGSGEYIEGNGILTTVHGEIFVVSMDSSKKCYAKKFNSSLNEVGTISFFSDSGEPDADMRVCGTGVLSDDLLIYWQITNTANPNYPKIYGQLIEGAASKWTSPPTINPIVASLASVPSEISQSIELVMCRSGAFEYAGYRKTTGILKRPYIAKLNNDGSLALEVEFADQTEVSGLNSNGDDGVVASFYSVSSTDTTKVSNLTGSLTEIKSSLINKGDDTAIGQSRYCAMHSGAYYVGVMLNSSGVNTVNLGVYDSDFLNSGSYKKDDEVITTSNHRKYRCLVDATFSNPRETATGDATAEWIDIGPTNKWALFDDRTTQKAISDSDFTIELNPIAYVNTIGFFRIACESIRVVVEDSSSAVIYDKTEQMTDVSTIYDYYTFFFYQNVSNDTFVFDDLPPVVNATIKVTFSGSYIEAGEVVFGFANEIGHTLADTESRYLNLSRRTYDDFGEVQQVDRPSVKLNKYEILGDKSTFPAIRRLIEKLDNKNTMWIGDIGLGQKLITYGMYERSPIPYNMPEHVRYSITVRGSI